jgi:general secretion pathway protein B
MSYILDALKKLEHEKNRKNRSGGMVNITGELFEHDRAKPAGRSGWKMAVVVLIAVFATFAITWKFLSPGQSRSTATPQPEAHISKTPLPQVHVVPQSSAPPEPIVVPAPVTKPPTAPVVVTVVRPLPKPAMPLPVATKLQQTTAPLVAAVEEDAASILTQRELRRRLSERKVGVAQPTMAPPADIKLSGIAFQDERRARRAVVNGFLMQEGSVVSGAIISDIYQDRVRFVQAGKTFELTLISTGAGSAGR